jgi:ketosteroid isomerase-like protein
MATSPDSRSQSKGETHVPITSDLVRKVFKGLESGDGAAFFEHVADDVDWIVMGTHPLAGHSLSDKAFIDHMFFRLSPMLPQGAQLHNESTTTGKEKSDGRSR